MPSFLAKHRSDILTGIGLVACFWGVVAAWVARLPDPSIIAGVSP